MGQITDVLVQVTTVRADVFTDEAGSGSPSFPNGLSSGGGGAFTNLELSGKITDTTSTGNVNGLVANSIVEFQNGGGLSLNGIVAQPQGSLVMIHNQTGVNITVKHEDNVNVATVEDRIQLGGYAPTLTIPTGNFITLIYDGVRWRLKSVSFVIPTNLKAEGFGADLTIHHTSQANGEWRWTTDQATDKLVLRNEDQSLNVMTVTHTGNIGTVVTSPTSPNGRSKTLHIGDSLVFDQGGTNTNRHEMGIFAINGGEALVWYNETTPLMMLQMSGASQGRFGLGTTTPDAVLHVKNNVGAAGFVCKTGASGNGRVEIGNKGTGNGNGYILAQDSGGALKWEIDALSTAGGGSHIIQINGTAGLSTGTAWTNTSDERLKDIQGDYEFGLAEILKLDFKRWNYKKDNPLDLPSDINRVGVTAQNVRDVIPDSISERKDGYLEMNPDPIFWAMGKAIQELSDKNDQLEKRLLELESKLVA